jgi:voltage-gated potassium channel
MSPASSPATARRGPLVRSTPVDRTTVGETRRRAIGGALFLLGVLIVGVIGYKLIGGRTASWLDALYMTVITLTTTGYREVIDISMNPIGQLFTIVLLLFGATGVIYFATTITAFVVEGDLTQLFRRGRMERRISALTGHVVVCGAGRTGTSVVRELRASGQLAVVVDQRADVVLRFEQDRPDCPTVEGDATDLDTLVAAGLARATGLVICTDDDKSALVIAVTARQLNPALRIVSRASDARAAQRLRGAGVDAAVSLATFGGLRLANELVRPGVTSFLDQLLHDAEQPLEIGEITVDQASPVANQPVQALSLHEFGASLLLLAVRTASGATSFNPAATERVPVDGRLIVMGTPEAIARLRQRIEG